MDLLHLGSHSDALAERADHPNPALLGRLEQLACTAIALRTTVRSVVNLDPSSAQARSLAPLGDEMRTSLARLLFHDVLFDHPSPAVMAEIGERAAYRMAEAHRVLANAPGPCTIHMAFHVDGDTTVDQLTAAVAAGGDPGIRVRDLLPLPRPAAPAAGLADPRLDSEGPPACASFTDVNDWLKSFDQRFMILEDRFHLLAPVFADSAVEHARPRATVEGLAADLRRARKDFHQATHTTLWALKAFGPPRAGAPPPPPDVADALARYSAYPSQPFPT